MTIITALISGLVFGIGLALSGMLDPSKVAGFLDLFGTWDPSLAFVMGGGVIVNFIGYHLFIKGKKPIFAKQVSLSDKTAIDRPLLIGAGLFGIGWGVGGLCPGPGVASLMLDPSMAAGFVLFMAAGLVLGRIISTRL